MCHAPIMLCVFNKTLSGANGRNNVTMIHQSLRTNVQENAYQGTKAKKSPRKNALNQWLCVYQINQTCGFIKCPNYSGIAFSPLVNKRAEQIKTDQHHHYKTKKREWEKQRDYNDRQSWELRSVMPKEPNSFWISIHSKFVFGISKLN